MAQTRSKYDTAIACILTPLSWIYGAVTYVRNKCFDFGILPSKRFDVPVITVGNITVGGTGKTPHVEFLIENLATDYHIGVVSRGYKRKTKGFVLASPHSTPETIGDEPYQIYTKYGHRVKVAVSEKRRKGIEALLNIDPKINLILLDDAFQHRYVNPKVSVLLMDWNRPVFTDRILPLGRLRESAMALNRADFVIVSKVPKEAKPIDYRVMEKRLDLMAFQKLFFSHYVYDEPRPVFEESAKYNLHLERLEPTDTVMLLTGIANPRDFVRHFKQFACKVRVNHFPDHHFFSRSDLKDLARVYEEMKGARKVIVTTEKDAVRLANNPYFPEDLKPFVFYMPIRVELIGPGSTDSFLSKLSTALTADFQS